ncbi:DUF6745 domain-containing protein [Nonomuraea sp. NPDC050663]|uniref:DUF6745 domain-containing protein n=1 Tax=Nonomuraea sp. NPDC050663 TaxID=3364370 RepID=UPI0037AC7F19
MTSPALSPELAALLTEAAERWERIAYTTGPADRRAAEAGVRAAYRSAGLAEPEHFLWFDSPAQATLAAMALGGDTAAHRLAAAAGLPTGLTGITPGRCVLDVVRTRPWQRARAEAAALLGPAGWAAAWSLTGGVLWPTVNRLTDDIRRAVGRILPGDDIEPLLRRATLDAVHGQHDAAWLALFDALATPSQEDVLAPPLLDPAPLRGLMLASKAAGWWWPFEHVVLMCERPTELHRDDLGRLHHATGPALAYPDGFALHAWHGMPVPQEFGRSMADLSADRISQEGNAELRRVMLESFGFDRYIAEAGAKRMHSDATGVLWHAEFADDEPLVMVEVLNSTPEPDGSTRTYFLRVPPWVRTAREGVAWTFGLSSDDYAPQQQT